MDKASSEKVTLLPPKNILVVGDWLVDEYWVMGIHRSPTSSRTGQMHYRALHKMDDTIQSFCGAGKIASLLYQYYKQPSIEFNANITGIGLWNDDDSKLIKNMLNPSNLAGKTQFKLNHEQKADDCKNVRLINIFDLLTDDDKKNVGTTKVIRIYHSVKKNDIKYYRFDWEIPPPNKISDSIKSNIDTLSFPDSIDAVVVKDLNKGTVNSELIDFLAKKYKKAQWFVSSKKWQPDWLNKLKEVDLRLLLIPQVAAQEAIRLQALSCWITRAGYLGNRAFENIEHIIGNCSNLLENTKKSQPAVGSTNNSDHRELSVIVLPDEFSAVAYNFTNDPDSENKYNLFIQPESQLKPPISVDLAMASVFLPAMVICHYNQQTLRESLESSLDAAYEWAKNETGRILTPETWKFKQSLDAFNSSMKTNKDRSASFKIFDYKWNYEKEWWKQATTGNGIINVITKNDGGKEETKKHIELWRSMLEIDDYVCTAYHKRKEIRKLINGVQSFHNNEEKRSHISCALISSPGSGKTSLVRRLSNSMNLLLLPFNITQMISKNDILDAFDTIATVQAQNRNKSVLVFIDEIDAQLDKSNVYDSFLAPLEDGIYIRGGKTFHIDPCIWIFAGTEDINHINSIEMGNNKSVKKSDFVSRLSLGVINLKQDDQENNEWWKLENIYIGVSLLRDAFPDVRYITKSVVGMFRHLEKDITVRQLRNFIKSFSNIQYGKVSLKNIPDMKYELGIKLPEKYISDTKSHENSDDDIIIEIGNIPDRKVYDLRPHKIK